MARTVQAGQQGGMEATTLFFQKLKYVFAFIGASASKRSEPDRFAAMRGFDCGPDESQRLQAFLTVCFRPLFRADASGEFVDLLQDRISNWQLD